MANKITTVSDTPVSVANLEAFVARAQTVVTEHYKRSFPTLTPSVLSYELGNRYARIVITSDGGRGQRSAFGFVDMKSGNLLKSASWKGPAKNFPRGNVHAGDVRGVGPYGIG